jgi:HEPN domain-containing protein
MDEISKERLSRAVLQKLADRYASDARLLLDQGRWSSAYYLAGYTVECALKACIAKQIREHEFPDLKFVKDAHTHDLGNLLRQSGLQPAHKEQCLQNPNFRDYWVNAVAKWTVESRYENPTEPMAQEIVAAVDDTKDSVLLWLKKQW